MKPQQRTIHFYDLTLSSYARAKIKNPSCCAIADILSRIKPKGRETLVSKHVSLEISDWQYDSKNNQYYALLNRADSSVSDVSFKDFATKQRRAGGKRKTEGIEYSCHVIIKPSADRRKALMLMTMGSGVTYQAIEKLLRELTLELRSSKANTDIFHFPHPSGVVDKNGNQETYAVNYKFDAHGHMGSLLDDVLRLGTFQDMELVADKQTDFDSNGNLHINAQSIHVVASDARTITGAFLKNSVSKFKKSKDGSDYKLARISYKATDGATKTNTFDINNLDAAFTRKENVDLAIEVEGQQTSLNDTILSAMRKLL